MRIAVIGGGITGLTAAFVLTSKDHLVTIFEKEQKPGGLISSFRAKGWSWPVEKYYHHFFTSDSEILSLATQLGLKNKLFFKSPKTSVLVDGVIYRFDSPKSILAFPSLGPLDKIRLGLTTVFLKLNPFWQPLEKISATTFIQATMGKNSFKLIWQPLLESKFSSFLEEIPASWFWTRIKKRSFRLGYFSGGTEILVNTLATEIKKYGGTIFLGQEITKIQKKNDVFEISTKKGISHPGFDAVIATVSPSAFSKIFPKLSPGEKENLSQLKSLGSLSLLLLLKESFLTDKTYWLNITDRNFPFVSVVEHTNFIDPKYYGGNTLLYVGGYYPVEHPLFKMSKKEVIKKFLPYLKRINPAFNFESSVVDSHLFKDSYSQPVPNLNYSISLPKIKTSVPGIYWSSLHHVYPQDRGANYAILLGKKIAHEILSL